MKKSLINKIMKNGVYLYGVDKKVDVVYGIDLFGDVYFTVVTKGFEKEPLLHGSDYGITFSLKKF